MKKIDFYDDYTGDKIVFLILSAVQHKGEGYLLVCDEADGDSEETEVIILKAIEADDHDIVYEIVDDELVIEQVFPLLEENMEAFEN